MFLLPSAVKLRAENQQFQQQQHQQQAALIPVMQECVDAISEHQRLQGLMKGEWVKGLLPRSSIPADYTVQRIRGIRYKKRNPFQILVDISRLD